MEEHVWQLQWSDDLSVGIAAIDREHQGFIMLVNSLNQAIIDRLELAEIQRRMQIILDDWKVHSAHEEALFQQWHYPAADAHILRHQETSEHLQRIMASLLDCNPYAPELITAGLQVKQTLIAHLLNEDMKYRDFYRATQYKLSDTQVN